MSIQVSGTTVIDNSRVLQNYRLNTVVISGNTTAVSGAHYVATTSLTLTLPVGPAVGDVVGFSNQSNTSTCVIERSSQPINGITEPMTIDSSYIAFYLQYSGGTKGWVFV